MTSIDLRKSSLLAVTALSSVAALAFAAPAIAEPSPAYRVAQGAPETQLTDEEKQRLEALKRRRGRDAPKEQPAQPATPPAAANPAAPPPRPPKISPRMVNPSAPPAATQPAPSTAAPAAPDNNSNRFRRNREQRPPEPAAAAPAPATPAPAPVAKPQNPIPSPPVAAPAVTKPVEPQAQRVSPPDENRARHQPRNLDDAKSGRTEKTIEGNRTVIQESDRRTITRQGSRVVIQKDEAAQLQRVAPGAVVSRDNTGTNTAVVERPGNVKIITETDKSGQLLRRYRRDGSGRETAIIDNRHRDRKSRIGRDIAIGVGVGAGIVAGAAILNSVVDVPAPVVRVPREKYVVRYEDASEDDVYEALSAPPVDSIERSYTLDEVRATPRLRERMRRVDLDDINFEFGSWDVNPSEYRKLERIARAMNRVIERNPNEVFLIEGYTDAVGSDVDNLTLSDRRAETVSVILSEQFRVPFENLTTQGYGEEYLKVETDGPELANRRVAVRRITPLLARAEEVAPPPPPRRRFDYRRYDDDRPYRRWRRHNRYRDDY